MTISTSAYYYMDHYYRNKGSSSKDGWAVSPTVLAPLLEDKYITVEYFDEYDKYGKVNQIHLTLKGLWALFLYKKTIGIL
jgi:hypothetical protein